MGLRHITCQSQLPLFPQNCPISMPLLDLEAALGCSLLIDGPRNQLIHRPRPRVALLGRDEMGWCDFTFQECEPVTEKESASLGRGAPADRI